MGQAILSQPACVSKLLSLLLDQRFVKSVFYALCQSSDKNECGGGGGGCNG